MKAKKVLFIGLVCLFFTSSGMSADISWINGFIEPAGWTIDPCQPGQNDAISFSGPVGLFFNSCWAMAYLGGTPRLTIDDVNKVVELWFEGPPPDLKQCSTQMTIVCGITGHFGPLSPGNWTFKSTQSAIAFELQFNIVASSKTYYVDKDAPGIHNGKKWKWAFTNLQDALAVAVSGDTVLVAQGTYKPDQGGSITPGAREASFSPAAGVKLIGSLAGYGSADPNHQDLNANTTILSGDLGGNDSGILNKGDNSYRVVSVSGGISEKTMINGFVITSGQADGSDPFNSGAGLFVDNSDLMLVNTTVSNNVSGLGGGIACRNAKLSMWNCIINGNNARIYGGGLNSYSSDVELVNCLMTGNVSSLAAASGSSAIYNLGGNLSILDCTIADNYASSADGKAIASYLWTVPSESNLVIANSILYNGGNEILTNHSDTVSVSYSDIQGSWTGTGNINKNPQFVNAGHRDGSGQWINGDYSLKSNSPCVDKGSNSLLPLDIPDLDKDGNKSEKLPIDLAGNNRVLNTTVDMGAYERAATTPPPQVVPYIQDYVWYNVTSPVPSSPIIVQSGTVTYEVYVDVPSIISLGIVPASGISGTWSATFTTNPGVVQPGSVLVSLTIRGENVDVSHLLAGWNQLAVLTIYTQAVAQ